MVQVVGIDGRVYRVVHSQEAERLHSQGHIRPIRRGSRKVQVAQLRHTMSGVRLERAARLDRFSYQPTRYIYQEKLTKPGVCACCGGERAASGCMVCALGIDEETVGRVTAFKFLDHRGAHLFRQAVLDCGGALVWSAPNGQKKKFKGAPRPP